MLRLPEELLMNVLSRLPAKSLGKSKCVCTSWLSLISIKHFVKLHLNQAYSDAKTNHYRLLSSHPFHSLDFESPSSYQDEDGVALSNLVYPYNQTDNVDIIGSCNGIVCLLNLPETFTLWNPTTRETKLVEAAERCSPSFDEDTVSLYGFGYNSFLDDYTLVIIEPSSTNFDGVPCSVYSLKQNTWKKIPEAVTTNVLTVSDKMGMYVNGFLHWKASSPMSNEQCVIVSFNVEEENFWEIFPPVICPTRTIISQSIGAFNRCLSIMSNEINVNGQTQLVVWIMKKYGVRESWTRCSVIDIFFCDYFNPVWFVKDYSKLIIDVDGEFLIEYNLKKKTARKLAVKNRTSGLYM